MTKYNEEYMLEFVRELAQLLEEYSVSIEWSCGEGSDTHGIFEEEMLISPPWQERNAHTISVNGSSIDVRELNKLIQLKEG